jgi:orotidine 5'-phosphate decarboxylase subfamily 1
MVIIALDFKDMETSLNFLDKFNESLYVKVGMELFYGSGLEIVKEIKKRGHKIFLDLKLHDIPNTVKKAMTNLAKLGVDIINLHAAGGSKMMAAALEGLVEGSTGARPILIAVTQLTSTSKEMMNTEQLIPGEVIDSVVNYAKVAKESGLDGMVCSQLEVEKVKVLLTHIGGYPGKYAAGIGAQLQANQTTLFISGHSHILKVMYDPTYKLLHINPGAAGRQGFHKVHTLVRFVIDQDKIKELEIKEIPLNE